MQNEEYLTMAEAARAVPKVNGRHPNPVTIWRWVRKGCHGVHLQHWRVGTRVVTTREAVAEFLEATANRPAPQPIPLPTPATSRPRSEAQRKRDIEAARARLQARGVLTAEG